MADPVKVVIADDSELFCTALEALLEPEPQIDVIGRAADGAEAIRLAEEVDPEVILMDLSMPVVDGFEATERLSRERPDIKVVVLTGSLDEGDAIRAREAGAAGYVTKDQMATEL